MAEIASAFVSLVPSAKGFGRRTEGELGGEVARAGKFLGVGFGKAFGAVAAVGAAVGITKTLTSSIGAFKDLSLETLKFQRITGGSVKSASRLQFAIHDSGVDVERATSAITIFSKKLGQAAPDEKKTAALTKLMGVRFKDAHGQIKPMGDLLPQLADRFAKMPDGVGKTALATQLFGRAGTQMLPFLNKGSDAIAEMMDKSDKLGLTLTSKGLDSFKKYRAASRELDDTFEGLRVRIGARLLPVLTRFITALTTTVTPAIQRFMGWLKHSEGVQTFIASLKTTVGAVARMAGSIISALAPLGSAIGGALNDGFSTVSGVIGGVVDLLSTAVTDAQTFFTTGAGATALQAALSTVKDTADKVRDGFQKASDAIGSMKDNASGFSFGNIDTRALGESLANGLINAIDTLAQSSAKIVGAITNVFAAIDWVGLGIQVGTLALPFVLGLATGLINGISDPALWSGIWHHLPEVLLAAITIAFLPSKIAGPLERILTRIPFVGKFLAATVRWLQALGGKLKGFGADLFKSFREGFGSISFPGGGIIRKVLGALKGLPGNVKNFVSSLGTRLGVWALDAFNALGRGARSGVNKLVSFVGTIGGKILRGLGKLDKLLYSTGADVVRGLISGIKSIAGDVTRALLDLLPGPLKKFAGKLGIKSPSKVFHDFGRNIGEGLKNGVDDSGKRVTDSVGRMADKVKKAAVEKLKKARDAAAAVLADLQSKASDMASSIADAFRPSDLFSGSLGGLIGGLSGGLANVRAALAALPKLMRAGIGGDFLTQLLSSGNTQLITALAGAPAQAKQLQGQFNQLQTLSGQLGKRVANNATSADIAQVTAELKKINAQLAKHPKETGRETANALNHTAAAAKRRRKVA